MTGTPLKSASRPRPSFPNIDPLGGPGRLQPGTTGGPLPEYGNSGRRNYSKLNPANRYFNGSVLYFTTPTASGLTAAQLMVIRWTESSSVESRETAQGSDEMNAGDPDMPQTFC